MIHIYKNLIINYINNKLSPSIIMDFASNNNFPISTSESIIIYNFIKRNYNFILNGDEEKIRELKGEIREDLYKKIIELYTYYKKKLGIH